MPSGLNPLTAAFCSPVPFNGNPFQFCEGQWNADNGTGADRIAHGPITQATNLEYQTRSEREAFARVYAKASTRSTSTSR